MQTLIYEHKGNLYVNLTNRCNNACEFCIRNGSDGIGQHRLWLEKDPTAQEIIDAMEKAGLSRYPEVVYCGFGEPIMALDVIVEVSRYLRGLPSPPRIRINTNGQGNLIHGRDIVPELKEAVDVVSISMNAPDAKKYDELCHPSFGRHAFYGILEFARLCLENGIDTVFTVVDVMHEKDIEKCRRIARSLGARFRVRRMISDAQAG
ncbi:MAG: TatD family nuclease-associated radical SAM protein [Christensenellales bacterium]|jgi:TatD family-associated radical SAM protein